MPTISMFYGIIISMFFEIKEKHHLPHIHIRYQGYRASVAIDDAMLLAGELPPKQLRMVQAWIDCIVKSCWRIGSLLWRVLNLSGLTRSSEEAGDVTRRDPRDSATPFHPAS